MKFRLPNTLTTILLTGILLFTTSTASAADDKYSYTATEIAPGLYMLDSTGFEAGNIGLSVGDDGVVLIDDSISPVLELIDRPAEPVNVPPAVAKVVGS